MNEELMNNKKLQELLSSLQEGETNEEMDYPLDKYGRMAMNYLQEQNPQRFSLLKMRGELTNMMYKVDDSASVNNPAITAILRFIILPHVSFQFPL